MVPQTIMLRRAFARSALALLAGCSSAPPGDERRPESDPPVAVATPAPQPALARCDAPLATAIVIEAQPDGGDMGGMGGMGGMQRDPYAHLRIAPLAPLARIARALADNSGCFRTLEPDPVLLALVGGVQPDLLLRVRAGSLRVAERSLVEKAIGAAQRYIGRYIGGGEPAADVLQSAEVSLELVCPKQKRIIQVFKGMADGPLGSPTLTGGRVVDTISGANHERMAMAYAQAQDAAVLFLRAKPRPCE